MQSRLVNSNLSLNKIIVPIVFTLPALFLFNGCGTETYEQRLNETAQYFAYTDKRNQALSNVWSSPAGNPTVKMRVPVEFKLMNAPTVAPESDPEEPATTETEPTEIIDPRQPDYIDIKLPGLEGAWNVELPVDLENESVDRPAYLYVLSNHKLLQEKRMDEALNFRSDVLAEIERAFNVYLDPDEFTIEQFPQGKGYIAPKEYEFGTFQPEEQIAGVDYQVDFYQAESGNNQVIILLVLPKNVNHGSKLKEHMDYSLETVEILSPQSGGGGQNASGSNTF